VIGDRLQRWLAEAEHRIGAETLPEAMIAAYRADLRTSLRLVRALLPAHKAHNELWLDDCECDACGLARKPLENANAVIAEIEAEL
jgi:hypothetical protein